MAQATRERAPEVVQPQLGPVGWLRFAWRQLTSMRTALFLLLLLAVGALPGSVWPQRSIDAARQCDLENCRLHELVVVALHVRVVAVPAE